MYLSNKQITHTLAAMAFPSSSPSGYPRYGCGDNGR